MALSLAEFSLATFEQKTYHPPAFAIESRAFDTRPGSKPLSLLL